MLFETEIWCTQFVIRTDPKFMNVKVAVMGFVIANSFKSTEVTIYITCYNIKEHCITHTVYIYVFCLILTINSDSFPKHE